MRAFHSVLVGIVGIAVFWIILGIVSRSFNPKKLICGVDGTLSTSKFQFLLWTVVIVFSYLVMFSYHAKARNFAPLVLPANILLVMGFSATTAVAAKGIAVSNATAASNAQGNTVIPGSGNVTLTPAAGATPSQAGIFQADDGTPDIGKVQLIIWTLIGVVIYLTLIHHKLVTADRSMPDIDNTLMTLMGLGQGTYLGKKIVGNGGS